MKKESRSSKIVFIYIISQALDDLTRQFSDGFGFQFGFYEGLRVWADYDQPILI